MASRFAQFCSSIHVRVTGLFLLLLALSGGAWFLWINHTLLNPDLDAGARAWWDESETAIAELGAAAAPHLADTTLDRILGDFGARVRRFEVEVVVIDPRGQVIGSSDPDSLTQAVGRVDPVLLARMSREDWDFDSYPDTSQQDAYVNRIFQVEPLAPGGGPVAGYLVASLIPLNINPAEMVADYRRTGAQAAVIALVAAAVSGLVAMTWLSRRVRSLSTGVAAFAEGELTQRVPAQSSDELGRLGRNFNAMAAQLATLIGELRNKELFQRQLIANISHDLRSPMAALRGYIETFALRGGAMEEDERERYLDIITANLDHLERLVDHLLQLSRLDAGQARFQMEDFALPELVDGVLARMESIASRQQIELASEIPDDLPLVNADPLQIAQVLQNLVDNGIKFNRPGGLVTISLQRAAQRVRVTVQDNGEGIPPQTLPHIFDRFYTGDPSRHRKGESNGLGLAIAQKIIHGHGGEITVESVPGQGSTFTFTLPAAEGRNEASANA